MVRITDRLQLATIRKDDVLIENSSGNPIRFVVKSIDEIKVMAVSLDEKGLVKVFPKHNLVNEEWFLEQ